MPGVLDESLRSLMNESVTIEIAAGQSDKYGTAKYATGKVYPARIDEDVKSIRTLSGELAISTLQAYVQSTDQHTVEDRLTLPAGYTPNQPVIMRVEPLEDEDGPTMVVLFT